MSKRNSFGRYELAKAKKQIDKGIKLDENTKEAILQSWVLEQERKQRWKNRALNILKIMLILFAIAGVVVASDLTGFVNINITGDLTGDGDAYFNDGAGAQTTIDLIADTTWRIANKGNEANDPFVIREGTTGTDVIEIESGVTLDPVIYIDSAGDVGIGGTKAPENTLHVYSGSAGTVTAQGNMDDIRVENSAHGGINLLVPDDQESTIGFGSPSDNLGAMVRWNHNANEMTIGTANTGGYIQFETDNLAPAMTIDSAGDLALTGGDITGAGGVTIDIGEDNAKGITITDTNADGYASIDCADSSGDDLCQFGTGAYFSSGSVYVQNELILRGAVSDDGGTISLSDDTDVSGYLTALGGVHVGGTSDPGTDNLVVDGTATITGTLDPNGAVTLPTTGISGAGSGSGLDADKLDGKNAVDDFMIKGTAEGYNASATGSNLESIYRHSGVYTQYDFPSSYGQLVHFGNGAERAQFYFSSVTDSFQFRSSWWTTELGGWNTVWHSGNDGAGSTLDADTLDTISSASFLRSDTADTAAGAVTFTGGIKDAGASLGTSGQVLASTGSDVDWVSTAKPAFSVYQTTSGQTGIAHNTATKLVWPTEEYDTHGDFASDRFTPSVAGKYILMASVAFGTGMDPSEWVLVSIYKNGVRYKSHIFKYTDSGYFHSFKIQAIVDANGSTDYFEVYVHHVFGVTSHTVTNTELTTNSAYVYFQGAGAS